MPSVGWTAIPATPMAPALTSDLFRLAPANFGAPGAAGARRRNLVTTHSTDLDRAGAAPGIWDPALQPYAYSAGPADTPPTPDRPDPERFAHRVCGFSARGPSCAPRPPAVTGIRVPTFGKFDQFPENYPWPRGTVPDPSSF